MVCVATALRTLEVPFNSETRLAQEPAVLACGAGSAAVSKVVVYGLFDAVLLTPS